jgi:Arm DNA-binding domain
VEAVKQAGLFVVSAGLYLQVTASGAKSWIYRYKLGGRRRDMGLGTFGKNDVTLKKARERAAEAREKVRQGIDPVEALQAERAAKAIADAKAMTFKDCSKAYIAAHQAGWRNRVHAAQWPSTLEHYVYPTMGALPSRRSMSGSS